MHYLKIILKVMDLYKYKCFNFNYLKFKITDKLMKIIISRKFFIETIRYIYIYI